jgi:hypothetical protein
MAPKDSICLGCNKKFTKADYCVQCVVCSLWIHKTCSGLSDEGEKRLIKSIRREQEGGWRGACPEEGRAEAEPAWQAEAEV